jgi:transcriptional regulator with XRE-family HTH domain
VYAEHAEMSTKTAKDAPNHRQLFGAAVRLERKSRGHSQEGFADLVGLDRSYMGGVERGERNVALDNIMRILETLEMQPSKFFKYLDTPRTRSD